MKKTGKGLGITFAGGVSNVNLWKGEMTKVSEGLPQREFRPLVVKPHRRAADMQAYAAMPSRKP